MAVPRSQLGWQRAALVIAILPDIVGHFIFNRQIARGVMAVGVMG
jgi:ABC-type glycerol-3-phosphate transport system permease component